MALSGLGLFLLEACAGTAFLLLFFPPKVLGRGFFSLHGASASSFGPGVTIGRPAPTGGDDGFLVLYTLAAMGRADHDRCCGRNLRGMRWRGGAVAPRGRGLDGRSARAGSFGAVLVVLNPGTGTWLAPAVPAPGRALCRPPNGASWRWRHRGTEEDLVSSRATLLPSACPDAGWRLCFIWRTAAESNRATTGLLAPGLR
jgi:hypothetical protein